MTTAIATADDVAPRVPALTAEAETFALRQRQARMFAMSPLVPEHLRKGAPEQAVANCWIALTLAEAMGEVPLIVMQNIHIVSGKAGFAAQYMIARANSSGVFKGRIDWRIDRSDKDNLSVTAFAVLKETGEEVSVTCDMEMARAEQWTKNPKYKSMPEVMLRYRSATFLVRFYAPDVMLGYQSTEELEDVAVAALPAAAPLTGAMLVEQSLSAVPAREDAPEVADEPAEAAEEPASEDPVDYAPATPAEPAEQDQEPEGPHPAEEKANAILIELRATNAIIDLNSIVSRHRADLDAMPDHLSALVLAERNRLIEAIKSARGEKAAA